MLRNYFISSLRTIWRNKTFSAINVLGLSIGLSAALVIFLIVHHEFSYDTFQRDRERIYRVVLDARFNGMEGHSPAVPAPLSSAIRNELTGIEHSVPVMQFQGDATAKVMVSRNNQDEIVFKKQPGIIFTNPSYFELLPFEFVAGAAASALKEPFSVVLTEQRARQYFPGTQPSDVVGKQVHYNDKSVIATVKGVVKDMNELSSFSAVEFISFSTIEKTSLQQQFMMDVWNDWMAYSQAFVKLSSGTNAAAVESQLVSLINKYNKDANAGNNSMAFRLQPLKDIHFNSKYIGIGQRVVHLPTMYGLLAVAAFLLLLGCINFINLTTAYASQRAKEIGIRKTIGSSRKQLVGQFLGETFFLTTIATLLSVAITPVLLRMFESFIPPGLRLNLLQQPVLILFLFLLTIIVSFLSGIYPALILSAFKPVAVLKNKIATGTPRAGSLWIRKSLTVSQFVIAQFFIIATVAVSSQISYSINKDMGFNSEAVFTFYQPRDTSNTNGAKLLNDIRGIPGVQMAARGFFSPADEGVAFGNISFFNGKEEVKPKTNIQLRWGTNEYLELYQIKLVAGRSVLPSDTLREFLVNESFARLLGFNNPEDILNKNLKWNSHVGPIVGVMKDFHDQSTKSAITPLVFGGQQGGIFHVKLAANSTDGAIWQNAIAQTGRYFTELYPDEEFNYKFLDERIAAFYTSERNTAHLLKWATALSILVSCLGLLGLVIYTTNTRTKEIGIRKILGASVTNLVQVLSREFILLIAMAFVVATPIGWWAVSEWLQDFTYRFDMSIWMFLACGASMLGIALLTLSVQVIRTAISNPVKSLRAE
jgi:putative ABC transport system permease protein